jgi:catechol 2,3-dioxygenase-like lactoylglutathione lyase family enzyme
MIGYVTIGTNDLTRAEKFYDALLAELGGKRVMTNERMRFYGAGPGPADDRGLHAARQEAGVGRQRHDGRARRGLEGRGEPDLREGDLARRDGRGTPGQRSPGFYGGYFRDPDGNKLVAFVMG